MLPGIIGVFLAADRVSILILARDLVIRRAPLGSFGHEETAHRVAQSLVQRILECALSELQSGPKSSNDVRRLAHVLDPAGQHDVGLAREDVMGAGDGGLDPRAAESIDGECRHFHRHTRFERDMPRAVDGIGACLQDIAEDDMIDPLRLDAGLLKRAARGDGAEFDRGYILQRAYVLRHRGARAAENQDVGHCFNCSFSIRRRILPEGVRGMASVRCHFRIIL